MVNIPMKYDEPLNQSTLSSINHRKVQGSKSLQTLSELNVNTSDRNAGSVASMNSTQTAPMNSAPTVPTNSAPTAPAPSAPAGSGASVSNNKPIPALRNTIQKGQKVALEGITGSSQIRACLGWNTQNSNCDVDVSAFLLNSTGKVIGDDWFVFYGQTESPDKSVTFNLDDTVDREFISIDFSKLNGNVSKIVFVLTINDALVNNLNFSMLSDAYIRIINMSNNTEVVSFKMTDYYSNVTSMMIGEVYLHNGNWKFNAIGNGVARDLAGLCELYGVQTI